MTAKIDSLKMVSGFGQFHTNDPDPNEPRKKLKPYAAVTWAEIQAMVDTPSSVPKPQAQWVIPSTLSSRSKLKQRAEGQYWMLWADFDTDPKPISEIAIALDFTVLGLDVNYEQYSSSSATSKVQKSRALVPLAQPLSGVDWVLCQRVFNELMRKARLHPDPVTERENQICYLPNRGEFYEKAGRRDGINFDPFNAWSGQIEEMRTTAAREADEARRLKERQEEARKRRQEMRAASGTLGLEMIEAFNQVYTPETFLIDAGYEQRGDTFSHPGSKSGSFSASVKADADGVLRVHSLSSSDPLYTGGGGGGAHDAFSTFTVLKHGGDVSLAAKDAGDNWLKIGAESWNRVKQREYMQAKGVAAENFEDLSGEEVDPETGELRAKHPLGRFVDLDTEPKAPEWVLPGFIGPGIVTAAGSAGVGKTTVLLPLAMAVAGLCEFGYELAPKHWRHVVYITEDVHQAQRILAGMLGSADLGLDKVAVLERLHIVEAMRLDVEVVAKVGSVYREKFCRTVNGVDLQPLVVVDTKAAVLSMDDENSNSESSRIVNVLKQGFEHLPVWIVGHIAKQQVGRSDLASLSMRGGSAFEADANQCLYVVQEGEGEAARRYLVRGKTRFEARWSELAIQSYTSTTMARDAWGDEEVVTLRWAIASPGLQTRAQAKAGAQEAARAENEAEVRAEVLNSVYEACEAGKPLNRAAVKACIKRKADTVGRCIEALLADGQLYEVHIPSIQRTHPKKDAFLVNLNADEQEEFIRSGTVPPSKLVIPPSWKRPDLAEAEKQSEAVPKKTSISSVPEAEPVLATEEVKT